jgi:endonuclease/exonuclease/phosphatase family metal-dependent hydrolase
MNATRNRYRFLLLWLALFLVLLSQVGGLVPGTQQRPDSSAGELVVMSYNIMVGRFHQITGEYESFPENLRALARVMRESGADIILMQEVDAGAERSGGTDQARFLGEELGFHHSFAAAIEFQGGHYGVALLSRWPIREQQVIPLFQPDYPATHPEWGQTSPGLREQRVAQVARVDVGGRAISLINTHLGLSPHQRSVQLAQIAAVITEHLQLPGRTVIFGGDLNCEPDARELEPVRRLLRDVYHQIPDERGMPRDIRIFDRLTFRSDQPSTCIDYIFIGDDHLKVAGTQVLETTASDHRPVVTRLRFR